MIFWHSCRVDRGWLSHILSQDFFIFCIQYLGGLWYAKVLNEPLATIEQYRISFYRNTMVVNDHFPRIRGKLSNHTQLHEVISNLNWSKILVYYSALQCKKVKSSIEKFHWSKKLQKTDFSLKSKHKSTAWEL